MKKSIITSAIALIITGSAFAQPVSDRAIVPLGVTLVQILRLHVTNGGNIEFVFNDIDDYKNGINPVAAPSTADAFYTTAFTVASSTEWALDMGAEDATLIGTDDPANTMTLDNVGFTLANTGSAACCAANDDITTINGFYDNAATAAGAQGLANALLQYTGSGTCVLLAPGALFNAGDVTENAFEVHWEVGTQVATGTSPMNGNSLLDQNLTPDRYTTNVLFDLEAQ